MLVLLPLTIGGLLYVAFRPTHLLLFQWAEVLGLADAVTALRLLADPYAPGMPRWVIDSAPAALWAFAFTGCMSRLWYGRLQPRAWFWITTAAFVGVGSELLQIAGHVPGTFDPFDLLAYVVGSVLGVWAALFLIPKITNRLENT
mgnify:CR=1 FL=1